MDPRHYPEMYACRFTSIWLVRTKTEEASNNNTIILGNCQVCKTKESGLYRYYDDKLNVYCQCCHDQINYKRPLKDPNTCECSIHKI